MKTTLKAIRAQRPCGDGWVKLLKHLSTIEGIGVGKLDDEKPLPIETILDSNGLDDALWCLRTVEDHDREIRLFAVWCARQVQHLMTDPRSIEALDVAERFARGQATAAELKQAQAAAQETRQQAQAAAQELPAEAAWCATWSAAAGAAWHAAGAVAEAAWHAAGAAAWNAAGAAGKARRAQETEFRRMLREGYP